MRKFILTGLLIVAFGFGAAAQGLVNRMAGEPKSVGEVDMPEGAWYFQLICEHEEAMLNVDEERAGDRYAKTLSVTEDGDARLFFTRTDNEYPTEAGQKTQRMFHLGVTKGEGEFAARIADYKGNVVLSSELEGEQQHAESNQWWYVVPVEGNSPYVTIQNRKTKKMLTLGKLTDGKYELILSNPKNANNADQQWKLRLMPRDMF